MKRQIVNISNDSGTFSRTMSLSFFLNQYREARVPLLKNKPLRDIEFNVIEALLDSTDGLQIVVVLRGKLDGKPVYARQWVRVVE